jgi:TonB family protein
VIAWAKWYPKYGEARQQLAMKPEDSGPLRDPSVRQALKEESGSVIEEGISHLEKALEIDPEYHDAMAYLNLFVRERGDLRDTAEEYRRDVETADQWVEKTLEIKKRKTEAGIAPSVGILHPGGGGGGGGPRSSGTQPVRVRGPVQERNLILKVDPIYPDLAKEARIQGVVRLNVVIGADGRVGDIQLVSGHPLLVQAAIDAVRQWVYKPTLLNDQPVEVVTMVDVNFTLNDKI